MATSLAYKVHSATRTLVPVSATIDGAVTAAMVDGVRVEIVGEDPQQGSLTVNFYGANLASALELFKPNSEISVTFGPKAA